MRTITKTFNVYFYDELSEAAKEKAKKTIHELTHDSFDFVEMCLNELEEDFPNSNLSVNFSLAHCQGDGFNIEGNINLLDALSKVSDDSSCEFSLDEAEVLKSIFKEMEKSCNIEYNFYTNKLGGYSCKFLDKTLIQDIISQNKDHINDFTSEKEKLLKVFYENMFDYFEYLDGVYKERGYTYLDEIYEEDIREYCDLNSVEFLENGEIYNED